MGMQIQSFELVGWKEGFCFQEVCRILIQLCVLFSPFEGMQYAGEYFCYFVFMRCEQ